MMAPIDMPRRAMPAIHPAVCSCARCRPAVPRLRRARRVRRSALILLGLALSTGATAIIDCAVGGPGIGICFGGHSAAAWAERQHD